MTDNPSTNQDENRKVAGAKLFLADLAPPDRRFPSNAQLVQRQRGDLPLREVFGVEQVICESQSARLRAEEVASNWNTWLESLDSRERLKAQLRALAAQLRLRLIARSRHRRAVEAGYTEEFREPLDKYAREGEGLYNALTGTDGPEFRLGFEGFTISCTNRTIVLEVPTDENLPPTLFLRIGSHAFAAPVDRNEGQNTSRFALEIAVEATDWIEIGDLISRGFFKMEFLAVRLLQEFYGDDARGVTRLFELLGMARGAPKESKIEKYGTEDVIFSFSLRAGRMVVRATTDPECIGMSLLLRVGEDWSLRLPFTQEHEGQALAEAVVDDAAADRLPHNLEHISVRFEP